MHTRLKIVVATLGLSAVAVLAPAVASSPSPSDEALRARSSPTVLTSKGSSSWRRKMAT